mgnify:CR=1 FL=1
MKLNPQYLNAIVIIIVAVGKLFGLEIASEGLSGWISSLLIVISGIVIAIKTLKEKKLTWFGGIKQ